MAACVKCQRAMPPSGRCVYCGDDSYGGSSFGKRRMSPLAEWAARIGKLAAAAGLVYFAYWLIFTPQGAKTVESIREKLGLTGGVREPKTEAQKLLVAYPKVAELLQTRGYPEEEKITDSIYVVTFKRLEGAKVVTIAFTVNVATQLVTGTDAEADALLR